jgi:hypothetical protein
MCARVCVRARPLSRAVLSCEWHGPTDDNTTVRGDKRCGRFRKLTHVTSSLFIIMLPLSNGGGEVATIGPVHSPLSPHVLNVLLTFVFAPV